ncbi:MAG: DUF3015 family protein [Bacteriovoracia bacterium]
MLNYKFMISILLSFYILNAFAFKSEKCRRFIGRVGMYGFFSSTTSYVSSTGECAMIGKTDHDAKVFIAHNFDKMLEDFAKGKGEYALAFAGLYNCDPTSQQLFVIAVKEKYIDLLRLHESRDVFNFLRAEISKIETAGGSCRTSIQSS